MQRETGGSGASAAETNILRSAQEVDIDEISVKIRRFWMLSIMHLVPIRN